MAYHRKLSRPALAFVLAAGILTGLTLGVILSVVQDLPEISALADYHPSAVTRILSADGRLLSELYVEKRLPIPLDQIPQFLRQAVIAVEDRRFARHPGLDVIRNFGALIKDIRTRRLAEGASTITQQLARNLFLTPEKTLQRKLKEIYLALQIERRYTKDEILSFYLNQIYFGAGAYGIGAAAQTYFGKPVSELTIGDCALLAGLPQSPEGYSPFQKPKRALTRRDIVLRAMVREGYLTRTQATRVSQTPINLAPRKTGRTRAPHFVQYVENQLLERFGQNALYKGGLTVRTTLDLDVQASALAALSKGLDRLETEGRVEPESWARPMERTRLGGTLFALDNGTGRILAWLDDSGPGDHGQSPAIRPVQPPGSALMSLIYAAAIESGLSQADRIWDAPIRYQLSGTSESWQPQNSSRRFEGEITLRRALEMSINIPAVKLLSRIGLDYFISTARRLGLTGPLVEDLTLALGTTPIDLLELLSAYSTLVSNGLWVEPQAVTEISDRSGRTIYQAAPARRAVLSPETAYIMTDMLQGVLRNRTAQAADWANTPLAGQIGATPGGRESLFIGYSPALAACVWIESPGSQSPGSEMPAALSIWLDFMSRILKDRPAGEFSRPASIVLAPMNRFTGTWTDPKDPGYVLAAFREGNEPKQADARR